MFPSVTALIPLFDPGSSFSFLQAMLSEAVEDPYAHRVLLQLLAPDCSRYFPQAVLEMMHPTQRTVMGGTGKMVTDIDGDEVRPRPRVMPRLYKIMRQCLEHS